MKKRKFSVSVLMLAVLFIGSGCTLLDSIFGSGDTTGDVQLSSDAHIVSFSLDGIVGQAVIDPAGKTVRATVEPMDVSKLTPKITVSDKATLSASPGLVDGEPVEFVVTAENGDTSAWKVTVTAQHGITFKINSTKYTLIHGATDTTEGATYTFGDDTPFGFVDTSYNPAETMIYVMKDLYDFYVSGGAEPPPIHGFAVRRKFDRNLRGYLQFLHVL